jgi:hypothetical protein
MINCSIPLILIGHHANDGGIMDGDTYLPQLHWEIFWGYLSANNGTKASKKAKTQNKRTSKFTVNPTWRACRILDS